MATEYTDVDRLVLDRWQDVMGLIEAHEELQDRVEVAIDGVGDRLERWLEERNYEINCDSKSPSFLLGKTAWNNKRKDDWIVYFEVGGFAPFGFRKVREDHPYAWLHTDNLALLRMKEPERVEFAKALRQELGDGAKAWADKNVDDADSPLGRYFTDIKEADRVELIADSDRLFEFATKACEELFTLSEPIDRVLAKFRPKE
jgi:hypothetical protein